MEGREVNMKRTLLSVYIVILLVISIGATAFYQAKLYSNIESNVEELDHYLTEQNFSGSILIGQHGEVLFEKAYGYQDQEKGIKNSTDTAFLIGSGTKQFTAAAILQLQEQGKLKTMDTINKYYSDYPNGENITIHHLLTHTSGLPEYLDIFEKDELVGKEYSVEEVVSEVQKMEPRHSPGEVFEYNNTNYFMLGGIVEMVSGERYESYIQTHLFEPAGMTKTAFGFDASKQTEMANGYMNDEYGEAPFIHPSLSYGGGALSSTTYDLFLWDRALYGSGILTEDSKKIMFTSYTSESLLPNQAYGYGQYLVKDETIMYHPGFIDGFSSNIYRDLDKGLVVIALSNRDGDFIPMIPALLNDFSERIEHSYIGYGTLVMSFLILTFIAYCLIKWGVSVYRGKLELRRAKWYRITFQTVILQVLGLILLVVPFAPGMAHKLFSSNQLLLVVAPFWGTLINLLVLLFVLASFGAIQPFIKMERVLKANVQSQPSIQSSQMTMGNVQ